VEKIIPSQPVPTPEDNTKNNPTDNSNTAKNSGPVKSGDHGVNKITDRFISWGFQKASNRKIDTIIIHSSYDAIGNDPYSIDGIIAEYKQYGVGAHYLIGRDGTTYRLVADQNIAYHAGVSTMPDGRTGVNAFSIGVEMVNTQDGKFTAAQYSALNRLIGDLKKQYPIKYILGHSDIAPGRKTDPWNIDWSKVQK
jgi:N-acetyl-anhydromuramyl-L-alanine amidase AmpD